MLKPTLILTLGIFFSLVAKAQLNFPNGPVLDLNTHISYLYFETEILFHTGKYKVDNYRWEKVSDSLDTNWDVSSCFNGDCWNGLPPTHDFIGDYGFNDTTGFIRFHVWTKEIIGSSVIKYRVVNNIDFSDHETLIFNIHYLGTTDIPDESQTQNTINLFPNPVKSKLNIQSNSDQNIESIKLYDLNGKLIYENSGLVDYIDFDQYEKGIYYLKISSNDFITIEKIVKE